MIEYLKLFVTALVAILALDSLWLGLVAKSLYSKYLGYLMAPQVNFVAAGAFYLLYIVGLIYFVIQPGLKSGTLVSVAFNGALFGLIAYATYDLTNLATIKNWPWQVTIIDILWGVFISSIACSLVFLLFRHK